MMSHCQLIVHADDFGISESVNNGIMRAHREGILTSTSIIANGSAFAHALSLARQTPTLDIGVHLTLTEETPILPPDTIPTLVQDYGRFHPDVTALATRHMQGRIALDEAGKELDAQICTIQDHGVTVSHLDGHQHIHMLPGIRAVVQRLAKVYGIPAIRTPRERIRPYMLKSPQNLKRLIQLMILNRFCSVPPRTTLRTPDHFYGFFSGGNLIEDNLRALIEKLPNEGVCEIMCHPGNSDPSGSYDHWHYHWEEELRALVAPSIRDRLDERDIELTSYRIFSE